MKLRLPSPSIAIALLALFVAIGGTGYAASEVVQSSSDPAPANTAKKKKALSKSDVNKLIAAYVKANKSTLTGAAGAAGANGAKGATGDTGPSNIYNGTKGGQVNLNDTPTTIAAMNLPAGKYLVQAVTTAVNFGAEDFIRCHLTVGGTDYPGNTASAGGDTDAAELTLNAAATLDSASDAVLICGNDFAPLTPYMESTQITAIRTGDLQTQTLP